MDTISGVYRENPSKFNEIWHAHLNAMDKLDEEFAYFDSTLTTRHNKSGKKPQFNYTAVGALTIALMYGTHYFYNNKKPARIFREPRIGAISSQVNSVPNIPETILYKTLYPQYQAVRQTQK